MDERDDSLAFSLLGGPLHQLGRRLGLVRGDTNTVWLGVAIGGGLWIVIFVTALITGALEAMFSLSRIAGHARLLVVIPLFFICESWVTPKMAGFVRRLADEGLVSGNGLPVLRAEVARMTRLKDAWWPEAGFLIAIIALSVTGTRLQYGGSANYDPGQAVAFAWVYYRVALVVFQFLALRWVWRLALWGWFLWRVSRLDLHLVPGHADGAGGIDSVGGVHERFAPLVAAVSVLECAALAEDLSLGTVTITSVYPFLTLLLMIDMAVFLGPLLVFTDKLWACRSRGMGAYMQFARHYAVEFEEKWLRRDGSSPGEPALGTADVQSMADLNNVIAVVRGMKWVPIGPRLITHTTMAALVPLAPLLLFKYPLAELAERFFARLVGL